MRYHPLPVLALLVAAGAAQAQDAAPGGRSWSGAIGVGAAAMPRYLGSDEYRVLPFPMIQVEYRSRVYLGGSASGVGAGLGAYVVRSQSVDWRVELAGAESRPESRGDALAGMGNRSAASFASSGIAYRYGPVQATADVAVGLRDGEGSFGKVGLAAQTQLASRWVAGVSTGATFSDRRNMAHDFGITGRQAAARQALIDAGDPRLDPSDGAAYAPDAGLKQVQSSVMLAYVLTPRSRVMGFAQGARLSSAAARSSIVRARNSGVVGLGVAYGL